MRRFAVIGCSAAGLSAAKEIRKKDSQAEILVITEEADPFYFKPYLLTLLLHRDESKIRSVGSTLLERFDVQLLTERKVTSIDLGRGYPILKFEQGDPISFDFLVIATGRRAEFGQLRKWQDVCFRLDSKGEVESLSAVLSRRKKVIVYGSDELALRTAHTLRQLRKEVVLMTDGLVSPYAVGPTAQDAFFTRAINRLGIGFRRVGEVVDVEGSKEGKVTITVSGADPVIGDALVTALPHTPDVHFARFGEVVLGSGIKVTADLQTTKPNIFAAGDCTEVIDLKTNRPMINHGWRSAVRQGETAGRNIVDYADNPDGSLATVAGVPAFFKDKVQLVAV